MGWPDDTAGRYAAASGTFTQLVNRTTDWDGHWLVVRRVR